MYGISTGIELSPEIKEKERMARQRSLKRKEQILLAEAIENEDILKEKLQAEEQQARIERIKNRASS